MCALSPQPLSSVNSSGAEADLDRRGKALRLDSTVNAVSTTDTKEDIWSEGTFPLRPSNITNLLVSLLHVHFSILHTSLTEGIVFSDGVSFEMRLPFGNCDCLFTFASWFNGLRVLEDKDQRQVFIH